MRIEVTRYCMFIDQGGRANLLYAQDVREVDEDDGKMLIEMGNATEIKPDEQVPETAAVSEPETGVRTGRASGRRRRRKNVS